MAGRTRRQIGSVEAFWDASALVPLCIPEALTSTAERLFAVFNMAVWWCTPVEIASALARSVRMKHMASAHLVAADRIATDLETAWSVVLPSESLRSNALRLLHQYSLSAADALQLSAALAWCENKPDGRIFLTADDRLREAARLAGFDTSHL